MALPESKIDIANIALDLMGEAPVSNIDTPVTDTEEILARNYDDARIAAAGKYMPNCCKRRAQCARNGTPLFDYTDSYALPQDFVRLASLGGTRPIDKVIDYDLETRDGNGRCLLLNNSGAASINIRYIADVEDVTLWDSRYRKMVTYELALATCFQITKDLKIRDQISKLLALEIPDAYSVDGQEVPPQRIETSKLLQRRRQPTSRFDDPRYVTFD